jgi:hypothetical protein
MVQGRGLCRPLRGAWDLSCYAALIVTAIVCYVIWRAAT